MPLNTAGSQDSAGGDPLSMAIQAEQRANPTSVSVNAPTKFGKLLNLVQPMLEGAAIGGFSGKGHPGGGFGAAQEFYDKQREHKLHDAMLQHTLTSDTFRNALEAAKTQHELGRPNFPNGRVTTARNAAGVPVLLRPNSETGVDEEIPGYSPLDKNEDNVTPHMTDQGLVGVSKTGEAAPITLSGAPQTVATPVGSKGTVPGRYSGAGASPSITKQVPGAPIPLGPPKPKGSEKPDSVDLQDFDYLTKPIEEGGMGLTPDQAHARMKAQGRKPDNSDQPLSGAKYNAARQKIQGNLDRDLKGSETTRAKDIKAAMDDPDQIRQAEEDNADRKQQIHQKYADEADAMGINLGKVPDYRSQLGGGAPEQTADVPQSAPGSKNTGQPKLNDTRTYQGVPYKFDGKKWVKSKGKAA